MARDLPAPGFSQTEILLRAARQGDERALDDLLRRYLPWVRQTVALSLRRPLRGCSDLDDIVQETLIDAFSSLEAFHESEGAFRAWLVGIVLHNVRDATRWNARQRRNPARVERQLDWCLPSGDDAAVASREASPSQLAQLHELEDRIERAMLALSETHRETLVLRERCGMTYAEIAAHLGFKNADTARALHHRAQRRLEALLDPPR